MMKYSVIQSSSIQVTPSTSACLQLCYADQTLFILDAEQDGAYFIPTREMIITEGVL